MAHVELKGAGRAFGPVEVMEGIDLTIASGKLIVFVGPSGSGKSTLLRMIADLDIATRGRILIDCRDVTFDEPADRGIAMVFRSIAKLLASDCGALAKAGSCGRFGGVVGPKAERVGSGVAV